MLLQEEKLILMSNQSGFVLSRHSKTNKVFNLILKSNYKGSVRHIIGDWQILSKDRNEESISGRRSVRIISVEHFSKWSGNKTCSWHVVIRKENTK